MSHVRVKLLNKLKTVIVYKFFTAHDIWFKSISLPQEPDMRILPRNLPIGTQKILSQRANALNAPVNN